MTSERGYIDIAKSHVPPGTTQGKHTFSDPKPKCSLQIAGDGSTIDMAPVESTWIILCKRKRRFTSMLKTELQQSEPFQS